MKWTSEHRDNASNFAARLRGRGFNFFTGVPCSLLGALIEELEGSSGGAPYLPAVREDAAIGIATGARMAGKKPAVLMQNSGLGYSLNVLTSLNLIYKIPVLLLVTYRGLGPDAPEHIVMGKSCVALLQEIGVQTAVPEPAELPAALERADATLSKGMPSAIFIKRGIFGA